VQTLEYGSCYAYAPRGTSELSGRSRGIVGQIKKGDSALMPRIAARVADFSAKQRYPNFFGPGVTLVPMPGSAPLVRGGLWVADRIAQALRAAYLARDVPQMISRVTAVKKSAFQIASERPTLQDHFDSFAVQVLTPAPTHIVVIDDVITAGTTLLAAAMRVALAYPNAQVRGFAIVRTKSSGDITSFQDPSVGTARPRGLRAVRRP
jgi:hypothetical protein